MVNRRTQRVATIDEYLAAVSETQRAALEKLRKTIRSIAPKAEECISYRLPAFRLNGKIIAGFGTAAGHCSYYPFSGKTIVALKAQLAAYETSKGAIRFRTDRPLPAALVRKLVRTRMAEIEAGTTQVRKPGAKKAKSK